MRTARATPGRDWAFAAAAGLLVLAAAGWLRALSVPYLIAAGGATAALLPLALRAPRRAARLALVAIAVAFLGVAGLAQRGLSRAAGEWSAVERETVRDGATALAARLASAEATLRAVARLALDAPPARDEAFAFLAERRRETGDAIGGEWSVVLAREGRRIAWAGTPRVDPDEATAPASVSGSAFYLVLHAVEERGAARATASVVVHADPPADRLVEALDEGVLATTGVRRFAFQPPAEAERAAEGAFTFRAAGVPLFAARAVPPDQGEVRQQLAERARLRGGVLVALLLVAFLAAVWPRPASLARRLVAIAAALGAVAIVPLSAYSNASPIFDPLYYFAPLGGPFTANAGALLASSALVLLALLTVLRWRVRARSRAVAALGVLLVATLGPFLLRDLARGITPPATGVTPGLWLAWEITLFLAACGVLLAGASAGQAALGGRRGLPEWVAPAIAAFTAMLAQPLLAGNGRFPGWYPALWVAAIGALALTRRARGLLLAAATVAGFGAATLVWGTTVRKRVDLARRDVAGLATPDPYARTLLERLARQLAAEEAPVTRAGLLKRFTTSDLAAAGYPVALVALDPDDAVEAALATAPGIGLRAGAALDTLRMAARAAGEPRIADLPGAFGAELLAAVPHDDGRMTAVAVAARTRLLAEDPFAPLFGLAPPSASEPPYRIALQPGGTPAAPTGAEGRWRRTGDDLHGDWVLGGSTGTVRAHAEVELRPIDALIQRGALVVLLDLAIVALLWGASAMGDGGVPRFVRARWQGWGRSYRTRLTVALFAFFVIPAVAFAVWSYRRLQADDRQARALLVTESLRGVDTADFDRMDVAAARAQAPLLLYRDGALAQVSDTLLAQLAPLGRLTSAPVQAALVLDEEVITTREIALGEARTLVGYRAIQAPESAEPAVVAAPARAGELALDRRRRDLGVLVLFATAIGGLGALWLSGVAAAELARPIGTLREAALAIAAGRREPIPDGEPPGEFAPVFRAFRRMAADLAASRTELEEAQRRTAAVLRNVASGVVAVDADGEVVLANPRAEALLTCEIAPGSGLECLGAPEVEARLARFVAMRGDEEEFDAEHGGRQLKFRLTRLARGGAVLTLDDVTELSRAQRVLAWGEMARQVAHEIKNPLTPIRLGVQHLRRAHMDKRPDFDRILGQNVERILAEIDRLDEIARAFSKYGTAPTERPPAEPTDVAAVLRGVVELERMGEGGVTWTLAGTDAPAIAMARQDELHEVLLNILENARLAGARTVDSRLVAADGAVRLHVTDDGGGIAPEVLPRIFEPHFSTRTSGSGLGLAISRRLIEGWGGRISASSRMGEGTTLTIELPAVRRES